MSDTTKAPASADVFQRGTVSRLEMKSGFGYVRDESGKHNYIFVVGKALNHAQVRKLTVGRTVKFRVSGRGQVDELVEA